MCKGHAQPPAFAPLSSKVSVGFSGLFVSPVQIAPAAHACSCFQSRTISLCFVALKEVCLGASIAALQHRAPGPRSLTSLTSTVRSVGSKGTPRSPQGLPGNRMPRAGWGELVLKMAVSAGWAFLPSSSRLSHLLPPIVQVASATRNI